MAASQQSATFTSSSCMVSDSLVILCEQFSVSPEISASFLKLLIKVGKDEHSS